MFASGRDNKNGDQLYAMSADGSNPTLLTKDLSGGWMPAISPDRTRIAFTSAHVGDGNPTIYVMAVEGSDVHRITDGNAPSIHASWSPDGKRLLYEAWPNELYINDLTGGEPTKVTDGMMPAWSPDGRSIAFCDPSVDGEMDTASPTGADATLLSKAANGCLPAWSPDGKRLAFGGTQNGKSGIFVANPDGSGLERLTTTTGKDDWPAWSPDGTRIAFSRSATQDGPADVWVMNADGSHAANLTNSPKISDWAPSWR